MSRLDISDFKADLSLKGTSRRIVRPTSVVYWSRFGLAIVTALICVVLRLKGEMGIATAFAVYLLSYFVFKYGLKYGESELKGKQRAITLGSGTFVMTWAAAWIFLFTLSPY